MDERRNEFELRDRPTVVISEPHLYTPYITVGGHQYARVFAAHGWRVFLVSAAFSLARVLGRNSGEVARHISVWRAGGTEVGPNLTNLCFAHPLPRRFRHLPAMRRLASRLYVPNPRRLLQRVGISTVDLLWLNGNEDWLYRFAVPHRRLMVRIIDNYSGFGEGSDNFHPLFRDTLTKADAAFTCSEAVRSLYTNWRKDIAVVPNGVELNRFAEPRIAEPPVLASIPRPRFTYIGYVGSWFDLELVVRLAKCRRDINFVIGGPWADETKQRAAYPSNIHVIGRIPYADVPAVLRHSDGGLVPFKDCELVHGVSPIKVYEYLAAGLPVVSLRWKELELQRLPIFLARSDDEFYAGLDWALRCGTSDRANFREQVRGCTWERRLEMMLAHIGLSLGPH